MDIGLLSIVAGLISAICWIIGDIYLVGFKANRKKYAQFIEQTSIKAKELAILMLDAKVANLRFGALIANFTIALKLGSIYILLVMAETNVCLYIALGLIFIGYSLSPLAHVSFYYVGVSAKALLQEYQKNQHINQSLEKTVSEFITFLNIVWLAAVVTFSIGWIIYSVLIGMGLTHFPSWYMVFNLPLLTVIISVLLRKFNYPTKPMLDGAAFSIAELVTYIAILVAYLMGS